MASTKSTPIMAFYAAHCEENSKKPLPRLNRQNQSAKCAHAMTNCLMRHATNASSAVNQALLHCHLAYPSETMSGCVNLTLEQASLRRFCHVRVLSHVKMPPLKTINLSSKPCLPTL